MFPSFLDLYHPSKNGSVHKTATSMASPIRTWSGGAIAAFEDMELFDQVEKTVCSHRLEAQKSQLVCLWAHGLR